jgi:hypothetical protein
MTGQNGESGGWGVRIKATGTTGVAQASDGRLTLSMPIQLKRRSGRKQITLPVGVAPTQGQTAARRPWDQAVTPLQQALVRGHRWLALLTSGTVKTLNEIAAQEGVNNSYVSRMVNLTTLAPEIVEAILDDTLPDHLTLFDVAVDPPVLWEAQREILSLTSNEGGNLCE